MECNPIDRDCILWIYWWLGIRFGSKYGTAYNMKGNYGLAIKLKNGQKFLIGTQKVEELGQFLEGKSFYDRNF